jgi:hypothetical protein
MAANDRRMLRRRHRSKRQTQTLALSAGGGYATMLAITLIGNLPINLRVFHWDQDDGDRGEWRRLRLRGDHHRAGGADWLTAPPAASHLASARGIPPGQDPVNDTRFNKLRT